MVDAGAGAIEWGTKQYEQSKRRRKLNKQPLHTHSWRFLELEEQIKDDIISKEYRVSFNKLQNIIQNATNNRQSIIRDNAISIYKDAVSNEKENTIIKKL